MMEIQTNRVFLSAYTATDFLELYENVFLVVSFCLRLLMLALFAYRHSGTLFLVPVVEIVYGKFTSATLATLRLLLNLC
jgi:hypothetical protein